MAGATGAIGRRLVPRLVEAGHQVTAITRSEAKLANLRDVGAEPVLCDVFEAERLRSLVARAEPDAVINQLTDLPQSLNPRKLGKYTRPITVCVARERATCSAPLSVRGFAGLSRRGQPTGTRHRAVR